MARFPNTSMMSLVQTAPRFDLAESFGPNLHLSDVLDGDDIALSYSEAVGNPALRAAIARRHGVRPDDVVVTVGGSHALFLLAFTLCAKGDEAVVTAPLFPLARSALEAVGATVRTVTVDFESGYRIDLAAFRAALSAGTKLVSVASPQNPSGVALPRDTVKAMLDAMGAVCPDAVLLVDETYREATYGDAPVAESMVGLDKRIVSIASLSKCHGAPGVRIGWAITRDPALRDDLVTAKFSTVIACSALDEAVAVRVLERDRRERLDHFAAGLARVEAWVRRNARFVAWVRPDAGSICCIRLSPLVFDDAGVERFYRELESQGIRVANGAWFGDEVRVLRLGFGLLPLPALEAALAAISEVFDREFRA